MRIIVKAKTKAKINRVERMDQPIINFGAETKGPINYRVSVKESPVSNKANKEIIKALAEYFNTDISRIILITGQTSKQKLFEIKK